MPGPPVVRLAGVSKVYAAPGRRRWRGVLPGPEVAEDGFAAVDGVDLEVPRGQTLGLIGPNGAGKSTLLKLVAGVTRPTAGTVEVDGEVGSMIELGVGFHPDLTGRENAWTSLVMHGLDRRAATAALDPVAEFAGLREAMDRPLKHYSLGMQARLAFAIATHRPVDLLVVDEVLAVGDQDFQLRCIERIGTMVAEGSAVLFVSHEMPLVAQVCDRVVHLRRGRIADDGRATEVIERYLSRASSRFEVAMGAGATLGPLELPAAIPPWGQVRIEAEVVVDAPMREPKLGVDLSLPTVAPDLISASSLVDVPELAEPGRYRVVGTSDPIGFERALLRAQVSVVDGIRALASSVGEFSLEGGRLTARPEVAVRMEAELVPSVAPEATPSTRPRARTPEVPDDQLAVELVDATKHFHADRARSSLQAVLPGRLGARPGGSITALDGIDLRVGRGEAVGIIGPNGSGKSTLLRAVAGLCRLDRGRASHHGVLAPVLDLAAGFHPDLTGRENLVHLGRLLGADDAELARTRDWVLEFAGLGGAVDEPIRTYSSGMVARLGMAATLARPADVLLVDELLAVGDEDFRRRAVEEVAARVRAGATVLFVSHELRLVEHLCSRVVRLDQGVLVDDGPTSEVIDAYAHVGAAQGVSDATSGIRFQHVRLSQRHITMFGAVDLTGQLVVDLPMPTARLELSYLAVTEASVAEITPEDRANMVLLRRTIVPSGGELGRRGVHDLRVRIDEHGLAGRVHVVLSVVDERDESICAECWNELMVGEDRPEGFPGPVVNFRWTAQPR